MVSFVVTDFRDGLRNIFLLQSQCTSEGTKNLFLWFVLKSGYKCNREELKPAYSGLDKNCVGK